MGAVQIQKVDLDSFLITQMNLQALKRLMSEFLRRVLIENFVGRFRTYAETDCNSVVPVTIWL
jgi:hypothetical protein